MDTQATFTAKPGYRSFNSLEEIRSLFSQVLIPKEIPAKARLVLADWSYPPKVTFRERGGKVEVHNVDYNVTPTLAIGVLQLVFSLSPGNLQLYQGQHVPLNPALTRGLTPKTMLLANGKTVAMHEFSGGQLPMALLRAVGWVDPRDGFQFVATSETLTLDELVKLIASA